VEAIDQVGRLSTILHIIFIALMTLSLARLFFSLRSKIDFITFTKVYDRWILLYRALLGSVAFSGLVVMAFEHFHSRWQVWLMIALFLFLLYNTIKEFILYKKTGIKKERANKEFFAFTKKSYSIELVLILVVFITGIV
jgi:hypothetical protein